MSRFIYTLSRRWLDRSTGVGILIRSLRRRVHTRLRRQHRAANIAMLHAGRCGSSVLADLLNQHPGFRWAGELFEDMLPAYYRMAAERRAEHVIGNSLYFRDCRYYGFDSKYLPEQHLHRDLANKTPVAYVALLEKLGFSHYILLDRRNHLRRAVSVAIGTQTRLWNTDRPAGARITVRLDPARFVSYGCEMTLQQYFASLEERYRTFAGLLRGQRLLELVYEDDIERDPMAAYRKVCAFLGIEPVAVQVRLQKLNPHPIRELVENFDEVAAVLKGTPYAWMLDA